MDNNKFAAASYIVNFFQEINDLTHNYGIYLNLLTELENKYNSSDLSKVEPQEKNIFIEHLQRLRLNCHKCYIQYKTMITQISQEEKEELKKSYEDIKKSFIIKRDDLEIYVIEINIFLANQIMNDLLISSNQIINNVYNE